MTVEVTADEVVAAWERAEAGASLSVRRQNRLVDEADRLIDLGLADPAPLQGLLALLDSPTTSRRLKRWLRTRLLPVPPSSVDDLDAFRSHPLVGFGAEIMPIRRCLALVETNEKVKEKRMLAEPESPQCAGWLAGRAAAALGASWPQTAAGNPLTHVVAIDLAATAMDLGDLETIFADLDLPQTGVLQLFHDLRTYGDEAGDQASQAWHVEWIEQPTGLLKLPHALKGRRPGLAPVSPLPALSIPSIDAVGLRGDEGERYSTVLDHIEDDLRNPVNTGTFIDDNRPSRWESAYIPEAPTSRIGGFGYHAWNEELEDLLAATLPLASAEDSYFLLFDIAGVRHLEDWFGDSGHLQVWIRRSDLRARRFDRTWCVIRDD